MICFMFGRLSWPAAVAHSVKPMITPANARIVLVVGEGMRATRIDRAILA
jgi:hypothetical protein